MPVSPIRRRGLSTRAQRLMWDAHSATGVTLGLVLFVIFFSGAFALYRTQLDAYANVALRGPVALTTDEVVGPLFDETPPALGSQVTVFYPFGERRSVFVRYTPEGEDVAVVQQVSVTTGEAFAFAEESRLSLILYQLHFLLQLRYVLPGHSLIGIAIAGLFAVFMLFGTVSGLLIHLKKLPREWHTFRARGGLRTALSDAHTVLGLVGLPFAVMYSVTGGIIAIMIIFNAPITDHFFDGDRDAYDTATYGVGVPEADSTGQTAAMLLPDALTAALPEGWRGVDPIRVVYRQWGDAGATATIRGHIEETLTTSGRATLSAATGDLIAHNPPTSPTALGATYAVTEQLHYGDVGGSVLDALFFVLALATSAVILTGNVLWIVVRRPKNPNATPRLHRLLARLTVGFGCGLVAAVPVLFIVALLMPDGVDNLHVWEESLFFAAWGLLIGAALFGRSAAWAARWQLALAGVLCLAVPVANGFATGAWPWVSVAMGWWSTLWIDVGFVLGALLLFAIAARLPTTPEPTQVALDPEPTAEPALSL
ncbi:MAG: PepSY-associated TM helix domain-containing protein [Bacteroidota bacterium]